MPKVKEVEQETQNPVSEEVKAPEAQGENDMIPRAVLNEKLTQLKEYKEKVAQFEAQQSEAEQKRLAEEGKWKELFEKSEDEKSALTLQVTKSNLITKAIGEGKITAELADLVDGNDEETITKRIERLSEYHQKVAKDVTHSRTASDSVLHKGHNKPDFREMAKSNPEKLREFLTNNF